MEENNYLPQGYQLREYLIEKVLGSGGFGVTYLAKSNIDIYVVIKEFLPQQLSRRDRQTQVIVPFTSVKKSGSYSYHLNKFITEAKILSKIRHPNVVRVFSLFEENNTAYFVMDYIEGESLKYYITRHENLNESEIISIIMPILEGLKEVHNNKYLHRDIAPDNIYLRKNGMPMLIDFGAAKNAGRDEKSSSIAVVKAGYSAPEQYTIGLTHSPATDIYSVGSVLYTMISGKVAPESTHRQTIILNNQPDPLEDIEKNYANQYSKALLQSITKAMSIRTKDRFQGVEEMQRSIFAEDIVPKSKILKEGKGTRKSNLYESTQLINIPKVPKNAWIRKALLIGLITLLSIGGYMAFKNFQKIKTFIDNLIEDKPKEDNLDNNISLETRCNTNDGKSCTTLGYMYNMGYGVTEDKSKAVELYRKACNLNNARGCASLGYMYEKGYGVIENKSKAVELYRKGCDLNDGYGCTNLGVMYSNGYGVTKDKSKAVILYRKGCTLGNQKACKFKSDISVEDVTKGYYIKIGEFYKPTMFIKKIQLNNLDYKIIKSKDKTLTKVFVGPFLTQKDAQDSLAKVRRKVAKDAYIIRIK